MTVEIFDMWQLKQVKSEVRRLAVNSAALATMLVGTSLTLAPLATAQQVSRPTVLELFTSQGCSSCPAADALFVKYVNRPDVIALSYSVHYWDYLGWKDTLASPRFTERQKLYAKARGDGQVYTPQIVVSGLDHAVGSDKAAIDAATVKAQKRETWVPVTLTRGAGGAQLEVAPSANWSRASAVWLATVSRRVDVTVKQGENGGRTLTYFNVVRSLTQVGNYDGKPLSLALDMKVIDQSEVDQIAVFVQVGQSGPIVGAATLAMK